MGWLPGFFGRKKTQNYQPPPNDSTAQNSASQNSTTMLELVVEETIMTAAKWLVTFVNRSLETKATAPIVEPEPAANHAKSSYVETQDSETIETLLSKFGCLIEQSHDRTQLTIALEDRLSKVEASLKQSNHLEQQIQELNRSFAHLESRLTNVEKLIQPNTNINQALTHVGRNLEQYIQISNQSIANLENRLTTVEDLVEQGDSSLTKITEIGQNLAILKNRVVHLEQLLARFSLIPKIVESNYQAIASLQQHLKSLDALPDAYENHSNGKRAHTAITKIG